MTQSKYEASQEILLALRAVVSRTGHDYGIALTAFLRDDSNGTLEAMMDARAVDMNLARIELKSYVRSARESGDE